MSRLFAVSDIHGYLRPLQAALRAAGLVDDAGDWVATETDFAVLGDVIDRGPDSRGVVDYLLKLRAQVSASGGEMCMLLGNHEQMLIQGPHLPDTAGRVWWENGGIACLQSYGIDPGDRYDPAHTHAIMAVHQDYFMALESFAIAEDTLLVHAGAPVNRKLAELGQTTDHLWIAPRHFVKANPKYLQRQYGVERVVFGHSPLNPGGVTPFGGGRFLGIDSGSFLEGGAIAVVELLPKLAYRVAGLGAVAAGAV